MALKVYISGAISGVLYEEYSDLFGRAEAMLLKDDLDPVNPLKVQACLTEDCRDEPETLPDGRYHHTWQCYMRADIKAMLDCDSVAMLPGWESSNGATLEREVAKKCGMDVYYFLDDMTGVY